jgi:hypothetical protein
MFLGVANKLIPVGTAFTVGSGAAFLVSAAHNLQEVFNHELRLRHLIAASTLPEAVALKEVSIYVLHQRWADQAQTRMNFALWPVETFTTLPPTDVAIGFPQFTDRLPTLVMPLSFDVPPPGTLVRSVGYTDFSPRDGFDLNRAVSGTFNWRDEYSHRRVVVENRVEHIFARRFATGFVDGP